ncbi:MAG: hypothetical protein LUG62_05205 [Clostridiales bacterium]|nr:hypothetical protein [Clostridiales bacterium]
MAQRCGAFPEKICGILTEMNLVGSRIDYVAIGTGINVNVPSFQEEMEDRATSLYLETGKLYDRSQVIGLVLKYFETDYEKFVRTCDLTFLKESYERFLVNQNQPVRVLGPDTYEGISRGINRNGELLVEREDGRVCAVNAGEVSVRGLYSYV